MLEMGALLGALLAGALADRYSRKRSLLVACSEYPSSVPFSAFVLRVMFEAFGFTWVKPHCRKLSQLPSGLSALVASLACLIFLSLSKWFENIKLTYVTQPSLSSDLYSNVQPKANRILS